MINEENMAEEFLKLGNKIYGRADYAKKESVYLKAAENIITNNLCEEVLKIAYRELKSKGVPKRNAVDAMGIANHLAISHEIYSEE